MLKIEIKKLLNNMSDMFSDCSSLTSLNLSNFNTNNVNDMSYMFSECSSLKILNHKKAFSFKFLNLFLIFNFNSSEHPVNIHLT